MAVSICLVLLGIVVCVVVVLVCAFDDDDLLNDVGRQTAAMTTELDTRSKYDDLHTSERVKTCQDRSSQDGHNVTTSQLITPRLSHTWKSAVSK